MYSEHAVKLTLASWKKECFAPKNENDIVFRNHDWMLNVRMTQDSVNRIAKKTRGFENIRHCIEHPSELYGRWEDINKQRTVIMTYILHDGKNEYFVITKNGIVFDAYFKKYSPAKLRRKIGVKFIK